MLYVLLGIKMNNYDILKILIHCLFTRKTNSIMNQVQY